MKTKAVLFDLGGTIIKTLPVAEIMRRILEAYGFERSNEEIERARKAVEGHVDFEELPILGDAFWLKWNTQILERLGIHEDKPFLAEKINKSWWDYSEVELYPEAEKTLKSLKKCGLKVGLVTNGSESDLEEALPRVGLTGFFDVEITSSTIGKIKPNKEIFLHALKELGILPHEAIFVGDTVERDYRGAKECGLKALLINRESNAEERDVEKIGSLAEVLNHI